MKTSYAVLLVLLIHSAHAQLHENFDDGEFLTHPQWTGDTSFFKVTNGELQSQGPAASSVLHLQTPNSRVLNTEWAFYLKMDFDPSTSNYAKIYLVSDNENLENPLNGYFLKIGGETGSADGIDLYKQKGSSLFKLTDGISGHAGKPSNTLRIKVIRDHQGIWKVYSDTSGGMNFQTEGTAFDNEISYTASYGIVCVHSSTRKDLFYFDDLTIQEAPLTVENVKAINGETIEVTFNNVLDKASAEDPAKYSISSVGSPSSVSIPDSAANKVYLHLPQSLAATTHLITLGSIKDLQGNLLPSATAVSFTFARAVEYGDLLITEIFPDPSPAAGLPEEEFIELYNRSSDTILLSNFTLSDENSTAILGSCKLAPESYLILTNAASLSEFLNYGEAFGVSAFPSLNNSSDHLSIRDPNGKVIFTIEYTDEWYKDPAKKEGGYSLEMIHLNDYCLGEINWTASVNTAGGTPGKINSVYTATRDSTPPHLKSVEVSDLYTLLLGFTKPIDTLFTNAQFAFQPSKSIQQIQMGDALTIRLQVSSPLLVKENCLLTIKDVKDCRAFAMPDTTVEILLTEEAEYGDLVLNELLFNPYPNGSDFIEIYNKSNKVINLKNWTIATIRNDTLSDPEIIFPGHFLIRPGAYVCLTGDPVFLKSTYTVPYPERIHAASLPSFPDDMGNAVLVTEQGKIIDKMHYLEEWHFALIDDNEGVSLERISFYAPSDLQDNWHSAAETAGWATPGYENSQAKIENHGKTISIDPMVFFPDQDSYKDFASIQYALPSPGYVANVRIFDVGGRLIKAVAKNQMLGMEGFFQWDGTDENGQLANIGHYIVLFEAFNSKGEIVKHKGTVVLGRKF